MSENIRRSRRVVKERILTEEEKKEDNEFWEK